LLTTLPLLGRKEEEETAAACQDTATIGTEHTIPIAHLKKE
jgi:hypothetical protein